MRLICYRGWLLALVVAVAVAVVGCGPADTGKPVARATEQGGGGAHSFKGRDWCVEHGDDPRLRIALCGYEGEHAMPRSWRIHAWKSHGGYGVRNPDNQNKGRERIWLSPHCLPFEQQRELFGERMQ